MIKRLGALDLTQIQPKTERQHNKSDQVDQP